MHSTATALEAIIFYAHTYLKKQNKNRPKKGSFLACIDLE